MSKMQNGYAACDSRMLFLLGTLHDVQGTSKSSLYRNASEKGTLESLIERNFIQEVPTPFSNKRTCVITERGRILYEAMVATSTIWDTDPDSEVFLRVTSSRNDKVPENTPQETIAKTDNEAEEVHEDLDEDNGAVQARVDDSAFVDGVLYDSNGHPVAERIDNGPKEERESDDVQSPNKIEEYAGKEEAVQEDDKNERTVETPVQIPVKARKTKKEGSE